MAPGIKTGGRQKGVPNKANAAKVAEIAATGETPLEYMVRVMRDRAIDNDRRDKMSIAAAPYVHPKLANIEHTGKDGGPIETVDLTDTESARRIAFTLARARQDKPTAH